MKKFCLIGEKLGHSYSREIHCENGLDYSLIEISSDELKKFFDGGEYDGFNVTIPYKKAVIPYLNELSVEARQANAVNTVLNKNGKFYGYNTDIDGMNYMITRLGLTLKDKNVLILGSGATANTAITLCRREGAKIINTVSRSGKINYHNCYDIKNVQIIINATPVGMYPRVDEKPIECKKFKNLIAVFDCVYNPFLTALLSDAKSLGVKYSNGLPMLVKQATLAEEIWLNKKISDDIVEKIIAKTIVDKSNLVLYGMPSSGKTSIGKLVSAVTGKEFIDTDETIKKATGKTPSELINAYGEEGFRKIESQIVKDAAKLSAKIISLGGGAVLNAENVTALERNGVLIYVKRDLSLLSVEGRPLSKINGVEKLYEQRKDVYENIQDAFVTNNGELNSAVNEVILKYEDTCNKRS